MHLYAILRRGIASPEDVGAVAARSAEELDKRADHVRKIRSYVLAEPDGRLGTICIYEATDPEAIYEHGRAASLAVDEVISVSAIDVIRPDPPSALMQ